MKERDIIIAVFACGGKMKCKKEAEKFSEPPIVINVPGGSRQGFTKTAQTFRSNNSVLDTFFASRQELKNVKPRRICIVSYSEGSAWTTQVLRAKRDLKRIDTVIVIDGIYTPNLKAWVDFAQLAAIGGAQNPALWLAHTQIKPIKNTNKKILKNISSIQSLNQSIPEYISKASIDKPPISVYCKDEQPRRKLYHQDPLIDIECVGNVARFEYSGSSLQDRLYSANYVQPRFWQWLRERWINKEK